MDNIPAQEVSTVEIKKSSPKFFLVLVIILIVVGGLVFLFFSYKYRVLSLINSKYPENVTSGTVADNKSPFSSLIDGKIEFETSEDIQNAVPLNDSMKKAFDFLFTNRDAESQEAYLEPVLKEGEILIQVLETDGVKSYKLLASKNPLFKYSVGDEVPFNPTRTNPNNFLIQGDGSKSIYFVYEMPDFKVPDSFKAGDKIVFTCESPDCSDSLLSWVLVFRNY